MEKRAAKDKGARDKGGTKDEEKDVVKKSAMDAAIKRTADETRKATITLMNDIAAAKEAVLPLGVGKIAVACDSAEAVYTAALKLSGIETTGLNLAGLKLAVDMLTKQKADAGRASPRIAQDAAIVSDLAEWQQANGISTRKVRNIG